MTFARFDRHVERYAAEYIERLQALCRMPSVAARGTGVRAVARDVEELMQRTGGGTRTFEYKGGYPILFAEFGAGSHRFIVYGHYDVQPVEELAEWTTGAFAAALTDGKLRARGAANSKGDLVARLAAIEAYQKTFGKLPICLRYIVEGEDGLGSPSLYRFANEQAELLCADGCIWDDGYKDTHERLIISLGFKGILFLELVAHGARTDIHSKWGGIVPNPAWRLVHALETISNHDGVITIDDWQQHIAAPTLEDREALKMIELDEAALRLEFRIPHWTRDVSGKTLAREYVLGPTCTISALESGYMKAGVKAVVPAVAKARLDFRLVPNLTPARVIELLRAHFDKRGFQDIEIKTLIAAPYVKSSGRSFVAQAAKLAAQDVYEESVIYPLDPASGAIGALCEAANKQEPTPVVSFGISHTASNPHGPDENIRIEDFLQGIKHFGRVIHHLGELTRLRPAERRRRTMEVEVEDL